MLKAAFRLGKVPKNYPERATADSKGSVLDPKSLAGTRSSTLKKHNILIEPWRHEPGPGEALGAPGYRWTVSYETDGRFFAQGFEDSHAGARAAAEAFLVEKGIDLDWQHASANNVRVLRPRAPMGTLRAAAR